MKEKNLKETLSFLADHNVKFSKLNLFWLLYPDGIKSFLALDEEQLEFFENHGTNFSNLDLTKLDSNSKVTLLALKQQKLELLLNNGVNFLQVFGNMEIGQLGAVNTRVILETLFTYDQKMFGILARMGVDLEKTDFTKIDFTRLGDWYLKSITSDFQKTSFLRKKGVDLSKLDVSTDIKRQLS